MAGDSLASKSCFLGLDGLAIDSPLERTPSFQLGVDYCAHVPDVVVNQVAPELRLALTPPRRLGFETVASATSSTSGCGIATPLVEEGRSPVARR